MTITPQQTGTATTVPSARSDSRARARSRARSGSGSCPDAPADTGNSTTLVSHGFLARAAFVTVVLSVVGALLGLGRDQALAHLFGAGSETDAFLVAWTVPEFAATLLIEDGLAFALVPAFSAVVARRARGDTDGTGSRMTYRGSRTASPGSRTASPGSRTTGPGSRTADPVRTLVRGTLPRLTLAFAVASVLLIWGAPYLVEVLAPGLPDSGLGLAVDCTRLTGTCVLTFGLAGYCSAALRAHRRFVAPAAIYIAYNTAIITAMFVLGGRWGVRAAAIGVAVGGALMILTQLPSLLRQLYRKRSTDAADVTDPTDPTDPTDAMYAADPTDPTDTPDPAAPPAATHRAMSLALLATVLLFALCRQSQVLIERFMASTLPSGAISHLNYAQKVAQMPMVLALMLCTVTFPVVARALAEGDTEKARDRVERDLKVVSYVVLLGTAVIVACAPQLVQLLFQRGAFTAQDTEATAAVMRVYALGLLGQALVGALVRSYFSAGRPTWYPVAAMTAGIVATAWIGAGTLASWGVLGIAAANAAGITLTALILLYGVGTRSVPIRTRLVLAELARPLRAAVIACVVGGFCASRIASPTFGFPTFGFPALGSPTLGLAAGATAVTVVFLLLAQVPGAQDLTHALRTVTRSTVTRRRPHARTR